MKKILLIATGGTIASSESADGLTPSIDVKQLLSYIPEVEDLCDLDGVSVMSIDSTNMNPTRMTKIAETIYNTYSVYDGFVVSHGTDTMAYSAAALSYMLKNLDKPIVLTGSQLPIENKHTDAKKNLSDAILFANEDVKGVFVAFDGLIISGTHAMKVKTVNVDAFKSINFPVIATIKYGKITYNPELAYNDAWRRSQTETDGHLSIATNLCENILILKMFPGIGPEIFDFIKNHYKGVIIESFGIGGIPNVDHDIVSKVHELVVAGVAVVITTQCTYEGIDLDIYEVGQILAKQNAIIAGDMTTEALCMKLMWALGNFKEISDVKKFMETPMCADRSF